MDWSFKSKKYPFSKIMLKGPRSFMWNILKDHLMGFFSHFRRRRKKHHQSIPMPNSAIYGNVFSQTGFLKSLSEPSLPLEHSVRECGNNNNALSQSWLATTRHLLSAGLVGQPLKAWPTADRLQQWDQTHTHNTFTMKRFHNHHWCTGTKLKSPE